MFFQQTKPPKGLFLYKCNLSCTFTHWSLDLKVNCWLENKTNYADTVLNIVFHTVVKITYYLKGPFCDILLTFGGVIIINIYPKGPFWDVLLTFGV